MIPSWLYAGAFIVAMFLWPALLVEQVPQPFITEIFVANAALAGLVWYRCSSPEVNYFTGLNIISASLMSGCANITLLYLPFVLIFVYVLTIIYSLVGLVSGHAWTQERFYNIVAWFHRD